MTTNKYIIGIDPGANGGITILSQNGEVNDVIKMPDTALDIFCFLKDAKDMAEKQNSSVTCYLEDVGHGLPGQSSSATAKFARHNGHLEMALLSLGIKTITATPQKWQKTYQLGKSSDFSKTEWKNRLKTKAQQLFPNQKITLWNADALLIAEYGRQKEK